MMNFKNILVALATVFTLTGCVKDQLQSDQNISIETEIPEGFVKMPIDMSEVDFVEQRVTTRAAINSVATTRELLLKNMKAYVFDNQTPILDNVLIEIQDIILDYNADGEPTYYAVLFERTTPVRIVGVANASAEKVEELIGTPDATGAHTGGLVELNPYGEVVLKKDGTDMDYQDFVLFAEMEYTFDPNSPDDVTKSNHVLKNTDAGILPLYSEDILFDKLNPETLEEWEKTNSIVSRFAYARIDVALNDGKNDSGSTNHTKLLGVSAIGVPTTPANPITGMPSCERIRSHEITPESNQIPVVTPEIVYGALPAGITTDNMEYKYLQGLYMYSTAPLKNSPADIGDLVKDDNPVYLIVRVDMGETGERFFKLMIRYVPNGADPVDGESFFVHNSSRYLVNITKINSPGYLNYEEAAAAPPSNVEYSIIVDDHAADIMSNGQYYLGVNKSLFELEMSTYNSNMAYTEQQYTVHDANDITWEIDNEKQVSIVNFTLSYNGGTFDDMLGTHPGDYEAFSKVDPKSLVSSISAPGLECTYMGGTGIELVAKTDALGNTIYDEHGNVEFDPIYVDLVAGVDNWADYFGTHTFKVEIPFSAEQSKISIKVGELTREIDFNISKTIFTDYSNQAFVNKLVTGSETTLAKTSVANSYIIAPYSGASNVYYFPVRERLVDFWENYASVPVANIITADNWTNDSRFELQTSWYDGAGVDGYIIEKAVSPSGHNTIKMTFDGTLEATKHQNFAVNVLKDNKVIWTWHFWVTDYNPYINAEGTRPAIPNETFVNIGVTNGSLQRYGGAKTWETSTKLAGRAMMDRNLGALDTNLAGADGAGAGSLYYQYGRKDPFPGSAAKNADGTNFANAGQYSIMNSGANNIGTLEEAVEEPTKFVVGALVNGENWVTQISFLQYVWHDKKASTVNLRKSIFDPSPLGWMIPMVDVYEQIDQAGWVESTKGNTEWVVSGNIGMRYYETAKSFETYYPAAGMINPATGGKYENTTYKDGAVLSTWNMYMWTSEPSGASTGAGVDQAKSLIAGTKVLAYPYGPAYAVEYDKPVYTGNSRAKAMPVRPIHEAVY